MRRIEVRERGRSSISLADFNALNRHPGFEQLIADGIFSLVRTKSAGTAISAGPYVGETIIDGIGRITVQPKVPDALAALLRWSVPKDVRVVGQSSLVGSDSPVLEHFLAGFLESLAKYLVHGRLKRYRSRRRVSAVPHGRIDVRTSMQLEARGKFGVLAYTERFLDADNALNRFLALALLACEEFCISINSPGLLARTRSYMALFEEVSWRSYWSHTLRKAQELFPLAMEQCPSADSERAVLYGRAILWNLGAWPTDGSSGIVVPHSFFLNLETLFEEAVRNVMAVSYEVVKGSALNEPMFGGIPKSYIADPDIVVRTPTSFVVADTKYRDLSNGLPGHAELYQLHSHTRTLKGDLAVLIYPAESVGGEAWTLRELGETNDGIKTYVATVDVSRISDSVGRLMNDLLGRASSSVVVAGNSSELGE